LEEKQGWIEGEHFDFRADAASDTLWVIQLRFRHKAQEDSVLMVFAKEYAAIAKFRGESNDNATPSKRGEYTRQSDEMR